MHISHASHVQIYIQQKDSEKKHKNEENTMEQPTVMKIGKNENNWAWN